MLERIIVIGASAGGVETLTKLVANLPDDLPAVIFVVVHISPHSTSVLPHILSRAGALTAVHAQDGEIFKPGQIYIAPPDHHLLVKTGHMRVTRGPKENNHRPAVDVLFRTAAVNYGSQVIGVVLSGTLNDGTTGLLAIKQQGGTTIVQDPNEALYPSMPQNAIENVEVDSILTISEIASALGRMANEPREKIEISPVSKEMEIEAKMAELEPEMIGTNHPPGTPSSFSCPSCHGVLWQLAEGSLIRYRCRTGHAFSAESLMAQQSEHLEEALWTALKALEEMADIRRRMAHRAAQSSDAPNSLREQKYNNQAESIEKRAEVLRSIILDSSFKHSQSVIQEKFQ